MPNHVHTHGDAPPHEHADATPGHTHDASGNVVSATGSQGFDAPAAGTTAPGTTAAGTTAAGTAGAAAATHGHPGMAEHSHADATPGHSHDAERREEVRVGPSGGGMAGRIILTLLGAAGMIIGAFLPWGFGDPGTRLEYDVFLLNPEGVSAEAGIVSSAGGIVILLGVLALLGLVFRTGWLTTLAGVLGIVAFGLVLLTIFEADGGIGDVQYGLWLVLAGGILSVIAGFFGARPRVVTRSY
jgi:hypothetical protein